MEGPCTGRQWVDIGRAGIVWIGIGWAGRQWLDIGPAGISGGGRQWVGIGTPSGCSVFNNSDEVRGRFLLDDRITQQGSFLQSAGSGGSKILVHRSAMTEDRNIS